MRGQFGKYFLLSLMSHLPKCNLHELNILSSYLYLFFNLI